MPSQAPGKPPTKVRMPARPVDTGGYVKADRITHRAPLAAAGEVDAFVADWLVKAYELDAD